MAKEGDDDPILNELKRRAALPADDGEVVRPPTPKPAPPAPSVPGDPVELEKVAAELGRRYAAELARVDSDQALAAVHAELLRRARAFDEQRAASDDAVRSIALAVVAMSAAFTEMSTSLTGDRRT